MEHFCYCRNTWPLRFCVRDADDDLCNLDRSEPLLTPNESVRQKTWCYQGPGPNICGYLRNTPLCPLLPPSSSRLSFPLHSLSSSPPLSPHTHLLSPSLLLLKQSLSLSDQPLALSLSLSSHSVFSVSLPSFLTLFLSSFFISFFPSVSFSSRNVLLQVVIDCWEIVVMWAGRNAITTGFTHPYKIPARR